MKKKIISTFACVFILAGWQSAQAQSKPLEKVRLTVPAKALTFVPYYFGKAQGIFAKEGMEVVV